MHFGIFASGKWSLCMITWDGQFHHQASVICKQNSSHLHSLCVGILFNPTTLSVYWCKTLQLYNCNNRRGNEIFRFGVSLYKGHWCSVSCSSCFLFNVWLCYRLFTRILLDIPSLTDGAVMAVRMYCEDLVSNETRRHYSWNRPLRFV